MRQVIPPVTLFFVFGGCPASLKGGAMLFDNAEFNRFANILKDMIEKYGAEVISEIEKESGAMDDAAMDE